MSKTKEQSGIMRANDSEVGLRKTGLTSAFEELDCGGQEMVADE
jgi:hypothetical protein